MARESVGQESVDYRFESMSGNDWIAETDLQFSDICTSVLCRSIDVQQNGSLTHPQDSDAPLHIAAQRKLNSYWQQYADNQNISFLPAIMTTSCRMHCESLPLLFLQAKRETTAHFHATGLSLQQT